MKMRLFLSAGAAILAASAAVPASAAALLFDFAGPSGTAMFELDSNPTPDFSRTVIGDSGQFGFNDVAGTFNGVAGTASTISFGSGIIASLNIVAPGLGFTQFGSSSAPLFTGSFDSPTFQTGTYQLNNPFFGDGTLTISNGAGAVPEPATWAMMLLGFGALGGIMRSTRRKQNATVSYA